MDDTSEITTENEGTYEYACMRAELLGIDKPDYDEFMKNKLERETKAAEEDEVDTELLKEAEHQNEGLRGIHGGLEELNSILHNTQRRISRFKQSCGSLTNMLKIKIGGVTGSSAGSSESVNTNEQNQESAQPETNTDDITGASSEEVEPKRRGPPRDGSTERKSDLTKALDKHVDHLDSLIEKAENAQYSMSHQNKQMRKFLD